MNLLKQRFPDLDPDTMEYITSIATDSSMSEAEKLEIINEHLSSLGFEDESLIASFIEEEVQKAREEENQRRLHQAKNVSAYIEVIRSTNAAPEVVSGTVDADASEVKLIKQHLLRQYDPDDVPKEVTQPKGKKKNGSKEESKNVSEDEEELIYGLGANENKLFKVRQREEMRAKAKAEQEEARALKVQQKLKQQGNEIKSKRK